MEQGEDVVGHAAGVDVVHERVEPGRVAHETVEHEGGFSDRCADDIGVK